MIIKYIPLSILSLLIISIVFYFKTMTIFIIETYTSLILEKKIIVTDLDIANSKISAYIERQKNKIDVNILHILPLELNINFLGNIDTFSKYHSLKGIAKVQANLLYTDKLLIKSKSSLYNADINTTIKELNGKYKIDIDIKKLDLASYQKQNSQDYNLSAIVDARVSLTDIDNVTLSLKSKELIILNKKIDNINIDFNLKNKNFTLKSSSKLPYLNETSITSKGIISPSISAKVNIQFQDKRVDITSLKYKDKNLSIKSSIFDGKINLSLKNNKLNFILKHIDIKKLAQFSNKETPASGYINSDGFIDIDSQDSKIILSSKLITTNEIKVKNIYLEGGSYKKIFNFKLNSNLNNKNLKIDGKINYKEKIKIDLFTHKFKSDTSLSYSNGYFEFNSKHLNLSSIEKTFNLQNYASADVDIDAYGTLDEIHFNIKTKKLNILKYPKYFKQNISINIPGIFKNNLITINPIFKNKNFLLSNGKSIYNLNNKKLVISQELTLLNHNSKVPINIKANTLLKDPFTTTALFTHNQDVIDISSLSYSNKILKTNFKVDIKEVDYYKKLTKRDIHGPVKVDAHYDKNLIVKTPSFGGNLTLELEKNVAMFTFDSLELVKIDNFLNMDSLFDTGYVDGNIVYNIKPASADTYIVLHDTILNGVDLDKKLSSINNIIGLNLVQITKNIAKNFEDSKQKTYIKQIQLNVSLNEGKVQLDDVALATNYFRASADGSISDKGVIDTLNINILDKNSCAMITQSIDGNITSPHIMSTSGAVLDVVSSVPSALLNTGKKIINFSTQSVDSLASYITTKDITITKDIQDKGGNIINNTSAIVLGNKCKRVYFGIVKHPIQNN